MRYGKSPDEEVSNVQRFGIAAAIVFRIAAGLDWARAGPT
jgi:hypothetical protein